LVSLKLYQFYLSITFGAIDYPYVFKTIPYLATIIVISIVRGKKNNSRRIGQALY
jgi:hypothetical protein